MAQSQRRMDRKGCAELFYQLVYPTHPNEWEVDDVMAEIATLEASRQELLFDQVNAIWPVSHSLCLAFLEEGSRLLTAVPAHLVPELVRHILGRYESGGLAGAREIIGKVDEQFLQPLYSSSSVSFGQISARMVFYIRGISGQQLELQPSPISYTDTRILYVPHSVDFFPAYQQNVLFYKFLVSLHWGFIRQKTFSVKPSATDLLSARKHYSIIREDAAEPVMQRYFALFPDPRLAADLFFLLEMKRVMTWMDRELPGLTKQLRELQYCLEKEWNTPGNQVSDAVAGYAAAILCFVEQQGDPAKALCGDCLDGETGPLHASARALPEVYDHFSRCSGAYHRPPLLDLLGMHDFRRAEMEIVKRRDEVKGAFLMHLALLLESEKGERGFAAGSSSASDQSLIIISKALNEHGLTETALTINNEKCELSDELQRLIREIENDLGHVPDSYVAAAVGMAGRGVSRGNAVDSLSEGASLTGALLFDEWDFRRNGYRRDWCRVYEKEIPLVRSSFVSATLEKHKGLLARIRRQFEMMLVTEQFVGRQRDGDDFDLDAVVEAYGDHRAGTIASDHLFFRLLRRDRDIVTHFLVDMSNSTEGWVGSVIKESLVLLCEAMEIIGDACGIYGFSGMRRSRCEIFPIKEVSEPFSKVIRQRIGSIAPREYTRLGPAIRYSSQRLLQYDARTRLLVTITDGKPEDYDDYKGDYAVEDTRKALLEARGKGVQTFCITVDRQAHDYLSHMYGSGNYVFVDDIQKLPYRMVEMYRMLTS